MTGRRKRCILDIMLRTFDRYILSECIPTFLLSLGLFSFVLLIHRMVKLFDMVVSKGLPATEAGKLFVLILPTLMPVLLPVSVLLAVLLTMGRFSADSEIVAMRACGIGLADNLRPIFIFALGVTLIATVASTWLQPHGARLFRQTLYDALMNSINISAEAGTFSKVSEGITLYAETVDKEDGRMTGLMLHTRSEPLEDTVIFARSGHINASAQGVELQLSDARIYRMTAGVRTPQRTLAQKSRLTVPLSVSGNRDASIEELGTPALFNLAYSGATDREARLELAKRLSLPISCLILGLLGAAMAMGHSRAGKSRGFSLSLIILFIYYALLTIAKTLGRREGVNPELAMWGPNIVLAALTVFIYIRKNRERPLPLEAALGSAFASVARMGRRGGNR